MRIKSIKSVPLTYRIFCVLFHADGLYSWSCTACQPCKDTQSLENSTSNSAQQVSRLASFIQKLRGSALTCWCYVKSIPILRVPHCQIFKIKGLITRETFSTGKSMHLESASSHDQLHINWSQYCWSASSHDQLHINWPQYCWVQLYGLVHTIFSACSLSHILFVTLPARNLSDDCTWGQSEQTNSQVEIQAKRGSPDWLPHWSQPYIMEVLLRSIIGIVTAHLCGWKACHSTLVWVDCWTKHVARVITILSQHRYYSRNMTFSTISRYFLPLW